MSNWYIELTQASWDLPQLEKGVKAWLTFNQKKFGTVAIEVVEQMGSAEAITKSLRILRDEMKGEDYVKDVALRLKITQANKELRLHLVFNAEKISASEWPLLENQLLAFYQNSELVIASPDPKTLPDLVAQNELWAARENTLPAGPMLDDSPETLSQYRYTHEEATLSAAEYEDLKKLSDENKVSLSVVMLVTLTDILQKKATSPWFRSNLTLLNRLPAYPYQSDKASYATTLACLPLETQDGESFIERVKAYDKQLRADMSTLSKSSVPALKEVEGKEQSASPVIFTSTLEQGLKTTGPFYSRPLDVMDYSGVEPRTYFRAEAWEEKGELRYRLSYVAARIKKSPIGGFFKEYSGQIKKAALMAAAMFVPGAAAAQSSSWFKPTQSPNLVSNAKQSLLAEQKKNPGVSVAALQTQVAAPVLPQTPFEKMQAATEKLGGLKNLEPRHFPNLAVPAIAASAVAGLAASQIESLHNQRKEELIDAHYEPAPAAENYNETVVQFTQFINDSRQECLKDPYFQDAKAVDDNLAQICGLMNSGQFDKAREKIKSVQDKMTSLSAKLKEQPMPTIPDDPVIKQINLLNTPLDAFNAKLGECGQVVQQNFVDQLQAKVEGLAAEDTTPLSSSEPSKNPASEKEDVLVADAKRRVEQIQEYQTFLSEKMSFCAQMVDNLDAASRLDIKSIHSEILEKQKAAVTDKLKDTTKTAAEAIAPEAIQQAHQAALAKYEAAQKAYQDFMSASCADISSGVAQKGLTQYAVAIQGLVALSKPNTLHEKISALSESIGRLKQIQQNAQTAASGNSLSDLSSIGKNAASQKASELAQSAATNDVVNQATSFHKEAKAQFCDQDPALVGQCQTRLPKHNPYAVALMYMNQTQSLSTEAQDILTKQQAIVSDLQTQGQTALQKAESWQQAAADTDHTEMAAKKKAEYIDFVTSTVTTQGNAAVSSAQGAAQGAGSTAQGSAQNALANGQNRAQNQATATAQENLNKSGALTAITTAAQVAMLVLAIKITLEQLKSLASLLQSLQAKVKQLPERLEETRKRLAQFSPQEEFDKRKLQAKEQLQLGNLKENASNKAFSATALAVTAAQAAALSQAKAAAAKASACLTPSKVDALFAGAGMPDPLTLQNHLAPPTATAFDERLKGVQSQMAGVVAGAKGDAQAALNDANNRVTEASACIGTHAAAIATPPVVTTVPTKMGDSVMCSFGQNPVQLLAAGSVAPVNSTSYVSNESYVLGGMFGMCNSPAVIAANVTPAGTPGPPIPCCIMQGPKPVFMPTTQTKSNDQPLSFYKGATTVCAAMVPTASGATVPGGGTLTVMPPKGPEPTMP